MTELSATLDYRGRRMQVYLGEPLDISIPIIPGEMGVNCFYAPPPEAWPVEAGSFIGDTTQGGSVNFFNLRLVPHGNGTHTECVGHISSKRYSINQCLRRFHFLAKLITVYSRKTENGDRVVVREDIEQALHPGEAEALILRTMPNDDLKRKTNYSGANPPYIESEAMRYLVHCGIEHFLTDLPSVDREEDGGALAAHKAFWKYPDFIREQSTITELIYVPSSIPDGLFLLNLQIASLELDASPSKPVLYALK